MIALTPNCTLQGILRPRPGRRRGPAVGDRARAAAEDDLRIERGNCIALTPAAAARVVAALSRAAILQAVRQAACRCLASFASLPAERAMPYQPTVTRGLKKALDDPKRRVRLAAADARNDWYLLGHGAGGPA